MYQNGSGQERTYSIASAPRANLFELCVKRVVGGFFSNHLADLLDVSIGGAILVRGPHGNFTLQQRASDYLFVATGTGIAPMRSFAQWLFPADGTDRTKGKDIWMIHGVRHEFAIYYQEEFEALARQKPNFHYLYTLSHGPDNWKGLRGYVQDHVARIVKERAASVAQLLPVKPIDWFTPVLDPEHDIYAYICGANNMISSVGEILARLGWHEEQIIFEKYD